MLSEKEKFYASELLSALSFDELSELSNTVTRRANLPAPVNKEEAIQYIVKYESDVQSLLRRKKLSRTLLCHYLHYKNVPYNVNDDLSRISKLIITLWSEDSQKPPSIEPEKRDYPQINCGVSSGESVSMVQGSFVPISEVQDRVNQLHSDNQIVVPGSVDEMAHKFTAWFYGLINEEFWKLGGEVLGPEHLYGDSSVILKSLINNSVETAVGNEAGSTLLRSAVGHVLLQPSSVIAKTEPHGVVAIAVAGTVHKPPDDCVGAFRQAFTLVADPLAGGNWKIKNTELHVAASSDSLSIENTPSPAFSISEPD